MSNPDPQRVRGRPVCGKGKEAHEEGGDQGGESMEEAGQRGADHRGEAAGTDPSGELR